MSERRLFQSTAAPGSSGLDRLLLTVGIALLGLGVVTVYSASAVYAAAQTGSASYFFRRDLMYAAAALVALYVGYRIDYRRYQTWVYPILLGCLVMLIALAIPGLGTRVDGATRWFRLGGFSLQPSEPAKLALVIYLAYSLANKRKIMRSFSIGFLPHLIVVGLVAGLVLRQPDLGTAVIMVLTMLLLLFVAGTKLSYIFLFILASAPLVYHLIVGTPWRLRRLLAFLDPWAYRHDAGYQISESLLSVGSGGLWGLGLGDGKQKLFFLPAAHTDFIFASIGEELGWVGLFLVVMAFAVILWRGMRAAFLATELFGCYLALGITTIFLLQASLHMMVVLGVVPTKGITLPFISYGGSALVTSMYMLGVLLNVAARHPQKNTEHLPQPATKANRNKRKLPEVVVAQSS